MSRSDPGSSTQSSRRRRADRVAAALTLASLATAGGAAAAGVQPVLPLAFEANRGQAAPEVRYVARAGEATAFITGRGYTLALAGSGAGGAVALGLTFAGGGEARVEGERPLPGRVNVFRGSDPAAWRTGIPTYAAVRAHDVVPGVDAIYHGDGARLEYDLVVAPGVDPAALGLRFDGADALAMTPAGDLHVRVGGRTVVQHAPFIYQETAAGRRQIAGGFVVQGEREVGFEVCGQDPAEPLVIDPVVAYSTYLGGPAGDYAYAIAADGTGSVYLAGRTTGSGFPTTAGTFDTTFNGVFDIVVAKLSADGTTLLWSTYVGGSGPDSLGGIAVDAAGNVYVAGNTASHDFPTTPNAYHPTCTYCTQAVVFELAPAGDALLYSTYFGGGAAQGSGSGPASRRVGLDAAGHAYVLGTTHESGFPTTPDAVQPGLIGAQNLFLAKFDTTASGAASLVYSTLLGAGTEQAGDVAVDDSGRAYLTGVTTSSAYPTTPGAFDRTYNGGGDVVVSKIDTNVPGAAGLVYSTFLGGSGDETSGGFAGGDIAVNAAGEAFVIRSTSSTDFPTTANAYSRALKGAGDVFLTRLNAAGSALLYSTYLGGKKNGDEGVGAVAIDPVTGTAVIDGTTSATDFPVTSNALQRHSAGSGDAFVAALNTSAAGNASLVYSSYLGGSGGDSATGIAIGPAGAWLVAGNTTSTSFPVTPGAFQTANAGGNDCFIYRQNP